MANSRELNYTPGMGGSLIDAMQPRNTPLSVENGRSPIFQPGRTVATVGAMDLLQRATEAPQKAGIMLLMRHLTGHWDEMDEHDQQVNEDAAKNGGRVLSEYHIDGERIWLITDHGHQYTTFLLPSEY